MKIDNIKINKYIIYLFFVLVFIILLFKGYSYINSDISVNSTGTVKKVKKYPTNSLYKIFLDYAVMDNIASQFVEAPTGINIKKQSSDTNGKGIYEKSDTSNDEYPIYYYRGDVNNNNIIFANYCWKMVRTTDTGGIKVIYNGTPTDGTCNNSESNSQLPNTSFAPSNINLLNGSGYMYGGDYSYMQMYGQQTGLYGSTVTYDNETNLYTLQDTSDTLDDNHHYSCGDSSTTCSTVRFFYYKSGNNDYYFELTNGELGGEPAINKMLSNEKDSNIKDYIENTWYANNMTGHTDQIEDTIYCNDRAHNLWDNDGGLYENGSVNRPFIFNNNITTKGIVLNCVDEKDKFTVSNKIGNGKLKYPVGLLSIDEVNLAGLVSSSGSYSNYLINGSSYWLMSPLMFSLNLMVVYAVDKSRVIAPMLSYAPTEGVRPVISLKNDTLFVLDENANGTVDHPYIIQ